MADDKPGEGKPAAATQAPKPPPPPPPRKPGDAPKTAPPPASAAPKQEGVKPAAARPEAPRPAAAKPEAAKPAAPEAQPPKSAAWAPKATGSGNGGDGTPPKAPRASRGGEGGGPGGPTPPNAISVGKFIRYGAIAAAVGGAGYVLWTQPPVSQVDELSRGVIYQFGKVQRIGGPGLVIAIPFMEEIREWDVSVQTMPPQTYNIFTQDNQPVDILLNVQYRFSDQPVPVRDLEGEPVLDENGNPVTEPLLMKTVRTAPNRQQAQLLLEGMIEGELKTEFGSREATLIASQRGDITLSVQERIRLKALELYGIVITKVDISNVEFTPEFATQLERFANAKQEVEIAGQLERQAEITARTAVIEAKGQADAKFEVADGEARAIETIGKARAEALRLEAEALATNPAVIDLRAVGEGWDGKQPEVLTIMGGDGANQGLLHVNPAELRGQSGQRSAPAAGAPKPQ